MKKFVLCGALALALTSVANAQPDGPFLVFVDNIPGAFIDISGTGTPLGLGDDGEVDITTTVGNNVFGAGIARVGNNGGVRFAGPGQGLGFTNSPIPSSANFGQS